MATILADYKGTLEAAVWLHQADYRLTQILRYRGQREEATDLCRQALQQCNFSRRLSWDDSRQLTLVAVKLNEELGELSAEAGQPADAEKCFRDALDLRRSTFKSGREPARFYVDSFFNKQLPFEANHEMGPFCGYVETQLRLARILAQRGRPYAAELALGECETTIDLVCAMAPDVLRYRVARANCWAQAAQLLEDERPSEAVWRQWAAAPGATRCRTSSRGD
jgi:tetratricopeptide (TPR) repeat protein